MLEYDKLRNIHYSSKVLFSWTLCFGHAMSRDKHENFPTTGKCEQKKIKDKPKDQYLIMLLNRKRRKNAEPDTRVWVPCEVVRHDYPCVLAQHMIRVMPIMTVQSLSQVHLTYYIKFTCLPDSSPKT